MKLTTFICAALMAAPAFAEKTTVTRDEYCGVVAGLAESIMDARQGGIPLGVALQLIEKAKTPNIREMVIAAYDTPRYSSDEIRAKVVLDFSNDIHLQCLTTDDYL